jgi:predicted dehydrogenase
MGEMGKRHLAAIDEIPDLETVAVCDLRVRALEAVVSERPGLAAYTDWRSLVAKEPLDALVVATNGPSHAEIVIAAAEAGVPRILCEKPMATSLVDAERMIAACERHGVRLTVNHSRRWAPVYQRLKSLVDTGTLGRIRHIGLTWGGGQLGCLTSHFFDLVRQLTDQEPASVFCVLDRTGTPNPRGAQFIDPGGYGIIALEDGARVFFDQSEDTRVPMAIEIVGILGRVVIHESMADWRVLACERGDPSEPMTRRWPLYSVSFQGEAVDIVQCARAALIELMGDGPLSCTGEDGLQSLQVVLACHVSDRLGNQVVPLPVTGEWRELSVPFT